MKETTAQVTVSACKKTAARTKPWKVGSKSKVYLGTPTTWCRSKGTRNMGTHEMLFKPQLEDPIRYQRVNILNLDKLTALEWMINKSSIDAAGDR